jgi:two-component system response regulator WspF
MRVAIVNDLAVACEALRRVVVSDPALSIAWIARDGDEAIAKAATDRPDVILMDLIMPRVNGVEATRAIMRASPCPILVVTATVTGNASLVYEALGVGALDAVNTPTLGSGGSVAGGAELLRRLHLVARMAQVRGQASSSPVASPVSSPTSSPISSPTSSSTASPASSSTSSSRPTLAGFAPPSFAAKNVLGTPPQSARPTLVAIGASTGGPRAVADVLLSLPRDLRAAYLVVQHVSVEFVAGYAQWLAAETGRRVVLARSGDVPQVGDVLVAGEDSHLTVNRLGTLEYRDEPKEHIHKPSVDELFTSLASTARPGVAVLLTGMGRDGAEGLLALRRAGWHTIAQDEATSVVWGMPGAAHRLGAAVEVLPIRAIGPAVVAAMRGLPP